MELQPFVNMTTSENHFLGVEDTKSLPAFDGKKVVKFKVAYSS